MLLLLFITVVVVVTVPLTSFHTQVLLLLIPLSLVLLLLILFNCPSLFLLSAEMLLLLDAQNGSWDGNSCGCYQRNLGWRLTCSKSTELWGTYTVLGHTVGSCWRESGRQHSIQYQGQEAGRFSGAETNGGEGRKAGQDSRVETQLGQG